MNLYFFIVQTLNRLALSRVVFSIYDKYLVILWGLSSDKEPVREIDLW